MGRQEGGSEGGIGSEKGGRVRARGLEGRRAGGREGGIGRGRGREREGEWNGREGEWNLSLLNP